MGKKRIMLLISPSSFRDELVLQLGQKGFETIIAKGAFDALDNIKKYSIDKVVTQLNLPQFDGLELILAIKDLNRNFE